MCSPKEMQIKYEKISLDSLHRLLSIPLKTPQFPAQLSPESMFYEQCCREVRITWPRICKQGWADRKPGIADPLFFFFNKINYKHKLDTYINNFCRVRELYLERGGSSGSFSVPVSTARGTDHATGIRRLGWAHRKLGVACPIFSFFNKLRYRDKLYYICIQFTLRPKAIPGEVRPEWFIFCTGEHSAHFWRLNQSSYARKNRA